MALRWKAYAPNTILKAVEVQDLADNGVIQLDTAADLDDADLVNVNMVYVVAEAKPYVRQSAGVGASHWQVFSGGLSGLGGWADITATTGSPTKHEYTDSDGNDWTAYEFTGDGTVTTTEGLVDVLMISSGTGTLSNPIYDTGGRIIEGVQTVPAQTHTVTVGAFRDGNNGLASVFAGRSTGVMSASGSPTGSGGTDDTDLLEGTVSSITGAPVTYGAVDRTAGPGSGSKSGVVIVRVPRSNAKA